MSALHRHCLKGIAFNLVLLTSVMALAVGVRALPWLLDPQLGPAMALSFARSLLPRGLEVCLLAAMPLGSALGAAWFASRGEARSYFAVGVGPARLARSMAGWLCLLAGLFLVVMLALSTSQGSRGLARDLIRQGRQRCQTTDVSAVSLPAVQLSWLCFEKPRLVGPIPHTDGRAWFSAGDARFERSLSRLQLHNVHVLAGPGPDAVQRAGSGEMQIDQRSWALAGDVVNLTNLPLGVDSRLGPWWRATLSALAALAGALGCLWLVLAHQLGWLGAVAAGAGSAPAALALLRAVDHGSLPPVAALAAPLLSLGVPFVIAHAAVAVARTKSAATV